VHRDNKGVVEMVNSRYSRVPQLMHILRCLFFIRAHIQLDLVAYHVPGRENEVADAISLPHRCQQEMVSPSQSGVPGSRAAARVDITTLGQQLFSAGLAESMQRNYASGERWFLHFGWYPAPSIRGVSHGLCDCRTPVPGRVDMQPQPSRII
jgi:hypothetical protein